MTDNEGRGRSATGERALWVLGILYVIKATARDTGGAYTVLEATLPQGPVGIAPHRHEEEDELYYILDGVLTMRSGDRTFQAGQGDFVFIPRDRLHSCANAGPEPVRMLVVVSPAGFEGFLEAIGSPAYDRLHPPPPPRLPDWERITEIGRSYNLEIQGPPPTTEGLGP